MMKADRLVATLLGLAVAALVAAPAAAQEEPLEVINEASEQHCAGFNCEVHFVGNSVIVLHELGVETIISECNDELLAIFDDDGSGWVDSYENDADPEGACTRVNCNGTGEPSGESDWPITSAGEYMGTQTEGHLTLRICLDSVGDLDKKGTHCDMELDIENHGNHKYALEADNEICPIFSTIVWAEIDGDWEAEAVPHNEGAEDEDDIELVH